jgi:nucleotide-binding universal stress UspA family protein
MKILIASHGNRDDDSADPITAAAAFPWPASARFHVLSVAEVIQPAMVGMVPDVVVPEVQIRSEAEAKASATQAATRLLSCGLDAKGIALEGDPETAITDYAREWGADLIVVGSHDRSLAERLLSGNIPEKVLKHAPCSVLVIKHPAAA